MKKLFIIFTLILLASGTLFAQISRGSTAWVAVKSAALKSSTWFFAGSRGSLDMGAQVTVLQINGNWAEVRSSANASLSGWTSLSNLSSRRIVSTGTSASAREIAMAGKGFDQDVENAYRGSGNLNYDDVDKTEAIIISQDDIFRFIVDGRLITGE